MTRVIIESPYAGKSNLPWPIGPIVRAFKCWRNVAYARACMADAILRHNEAPYASHLLYTQPGVLDDTVAWQRDVGINAGFEWGKVAVRRVFYVDRGWSTGMRFGLGEAKRLGQPIEFRSIYGNPVTLPEDMTKPRRSLDGASGTAR